MVSSEVTICQALAAATIPGCGIDRIPEYIVVLQDGRAKMKPRPDSDGARVGFKVLLNGNAGIKGIVRSVEAGR